MITSKIKILRSEHTHSDLENCPQDSSLNEVVNKIRFVLIVEWVLPMDRCYAACYAVCGIIAQMKL